VDDARVEEWEALALESGAGNIISTGFAKKMKLNTTGAINPDSVKERLAAFNCSI
jgi:hypothetical protein